MKAYKLLSTLKNGIFNVCCINTFINSFYHCSTCNHIKIKIKAPI